jgi:hypothetical protein
MNHYGLQMEKTQPRHANENGDVESSHRHFKQAVDQALMMRGSREFTDMEAYLAFLNGIADSRNAGRSKRLGEEHEVLRDLPRARLESFRKLTPLVNTGSLIQVLGNTYSVHSRLLGEQVEARVYADQIEIWYAQKRVDKFPRLRGRGKHSVNYRHIIDWLVRKPGAFENYRYREDLFPTSQFRMAYDELRERRSKESATKDYLEILRLAAYESEASVDDVLRKLLKSATPASEVWTIETVRTELRAINAGGMTPAVTEVHVEEVDLNLFDHLFDDVTNLETGSCSQPPYSEDMEVFDDNHGCQTNTGEQPAGTATAIVP